MHFITNGYKHFSKTNSTDPRQRVPLRTLANGMQSSVNFEPWFRYLGNCDGSELGELLTKFLIIKFIVKILDVQVDTLIAIAPLL